MGSARACGRLPEEGRRPGRCLTKEGCRSVRGLRRLVFVFVVGGLLAAVPLSAVAREGILSSNVRQAQTAFDESLTSAVRGGFDSSLANQLMWRFAQVSAIK